MTRPEGKTAVITGAAGSIGKQTARRLLSEGANLALVDISSGALRLAAEELGAGDRIMTIPADVANEADVEGYITAAARRFGRIDILFNNAGIGGPRQHIADVDIEAWQHVMDVDLKGILLGMKHALRIMYAQGSGSIINTASQAGVFNQPGGAGYCIAKGAVIHLTKIAAVESGSHGVRVNCIMPGVVNSDMIRKSSPPGMDMEQMKTGMSKMVPLGRMAELDDIADAVIYLASDKSRYITGIELRVDGGSSIK